MEEEATSVHCSLVVRTLALGNRLSSLQEKGLSDSPISLLESSQLQEQGSPHAKEGKQHTAKGQILVSQRVARAVGVRAVSGERWSE